MPAAAPISGLLRDVVALTVTRKELRRVDLEEVLGISRSVAVRGLEQARELGYIDAEGATRTLRYVPTERGKKARAATSDDDGTAETLQMSHYGARLDEDWRVSKVVAASRARNGHVHDSTVTTRKATPEELARCGTRPAPSAAAPSAAATPATSSPAPRSTSAHGAASVPAPPSRNGHAASTDQAPAPITPPSGDDAPAVEHAIHGGTADASPAPDLTPVLGVMGHVTSRGVFAPAPPVEFYERDEKPSAQVDGMPLPDLTDVELAREQLRARYGLKLIDLLGPNAPEHIFDRVERLFT